MSIIYEALKKVEERKDISHPPVAPKVANPEAKKKKQPIPKKKNTTLILIFAFFLFLAIFFIDNNLRFRLMSSGPIGESTELSKANKTATVPSVTAEKVYNGYVLEGIMYDEEEPSAIVNGRVIKRNDKIDNFVVTDITQNSVELTDSQTNEVSLLSLSF